MIQNFQITIAANELLIINPSRNNVSFDFLRRKSKTDVGVGDKLRNIF